MSSRYPLIFSRLLWGFFGISALSAVIWMLGPQLLIGGSHWLEPVINRQLAICLCFFLWIIFQLIPQLYRAWFNSRLLNNLQHNDNVDYADRAMTEELLSTRFQ